MSFDFVVPEFKINGNGVPTFEFYKRGFRLGGSASPSWQDVILSGNTALTLVNAKEDGLNYLLLKGGTEQRNIPTEYTQVEYLDNNSTAWLDLGMPIGSADIVTFDMKWNAKLSAPFFGAYEQFGSYDSRSFVGTYYSNENSITFYANDKNPIGSVTKPTGRCLLKWNGVSATPTLDGNEIGTKYPPYDNFTPNVNAYLFTRNQGGVAGNIDDITLYGFKVERNGVLIMDLVPAKRNSDNVLGMYNAVTGTFLTNSGTGDFTAGSDAVPTPDTPMDIVCNNGVLKLSPNLFDKSSMYIGCYLEATGDVKSGNGYTITMPCEPNTTYTFSRRQSSQRYRCGCSPDTTVGKGSTGITIISTQSVSANVVLDTVTTTADAKTLVIWFTNTSDDEELQSQLNQIQIQKGSTATPYMPYGAIYTDGTVETVEVTGNLVDFNETRINSSTWDSADKTKGFEVYADVYSKSIGSSMLTNANAFGVFVPCKQGESVSLNFFDYEPFSTRCLYCEITADRKCNTTPQAYENAGVITQKTFTLTQSDSIGFVFEWWINSLQTRNYTKENYTVIKGTTPPTSYIPYFNGGSATAEMLLKLGTYQDVQSVLDGSVTRNVGVKVLDGTESWSYYSVTQGNMFRTKIAGSVSGAKDTLGVLCNAYAVTPTSSRADNTLSGANENFDFINNNYTTIDDWTAYLAQQYNAGFPVIVVYPLATPTTETVTGQPLTIQAGTNIVSITQASIDNLELEVSYKAGVAVTITEVQNAQLDNSVEVTING